MLILPQAIPEVPGAPWWVLILIFAIAPGFWTLAKWWVGRSDNRRSEYKAIIETKDKQIIELNNRLLQEAIEARDITSTMTRALERFLDREKEEGNWHQELLHEQQEMRKLVQEIRKLVYEIHERRPP